MTEAVVFGYNQAVLVTTYRNAKKINKIAFEKFGFILLGANSNGEVKSV